MTPEQLQAALTKSNEGLATTIAKSVTEGITAALTAVGLVKEKPTTEPKPEPKAKPTAPKGPVKPGSLKKIALERRRETILADLDWDNTEAVEKAEEEVANIEKELADIEAANKGDGTDDANLTPDQRQVKTLEKQIADIRRRSNQAVGTGAPKKDAEAQTGGTFEGLQKEGDDDPAADAAAGRAMAKFANEQRGYK